MAGSEHTLTLFAGYHLWSPWLIPTRCLAVLPLAYIAVRTRDVRIGILTHVVFNAADLVAAILLYLQASSAQRTPLTGRIAAAASRAQTPATPYSTP